MAFRARKVLEAFEKRAPGFYYKSCARWLDLVWNGQADKQLCLIQGESKEEKNGDWSKSQRETGDAQAEADEPLMMTTTF